MFSKSYSSPLARAKAFTDWLGIRMPVLMAPMAGACPPSLAIAVPNAGGLGAGGALRWTVLPRHRIPFSAGSPPRCGNRRGRRVMETGCKCGPGKLPSWLGLNRPAPLCRNCGTMLHGS